MSKYSKVASSSRKGSNILIGTRTGIKNKSMMVCEEFNGREYDRLGQFKSSCHNDRLEPRKRLTKFVRQQFTH